MYELNARSVFLSRLGYAMALGFAVPFVCLPTSYLIGTVGAPFRDALLLAADRALGFSWPAWNAWVQRHPVIHTAFALTYPTHLLQTVIVTAVLAVQTERGAFRFMRAFLIAFGFCLVGLLVVPAFGMIPTAPSHAVRVGLRDGSLRVFDLLHGSGLISMPSFHAALAVLITIELWHLRGWRWPAAVISGVMVVATVSEGGHYLVDVVAGVAVAILSAWLAHVSLHFLPATCARKCDDAHVRTGTS
jgi:membrane-associated phospholipid phosphatase